MDKVETTTISISYFDLEYTRRGYILRVIYIPSSMQNIWPESLILNEDQHTLGVF